MIILYSFTALLTSTQSNIFVDAAGRAQTTDFGLAMVTRNQDSVCSATDVHDHSVRWTAPEILDDCATHSKEGDVFSFAMVVIEVSRGSLRGQTE